MREEQPAGEPVERILLSQALAAPGNPIAKARGLPGAAYTSAAFLARELETAFERGWTCVAAAGRACPSPGASIRSGSAGGRCC